MSAIKDFNFPLFNSVAEHLRNKGFSVENPADRSIVVGWTWEDYLRYDIIQMMSCDSIIQLPMWEHSRGAKLEAYIAHQLNFTFLDFDLYYGIDSNYVVC
jgi:hypothetical protein